jgi:hypothetical protein
VLERRLENALSGVSFSQLERGKLALQAKAAQEKAARRNLHGNELESPCSSLLAPTVAAALGNREVAAGRGAVAMAAGPGYLGQV